MRYYSWEPPIDPPCEEPEPTVYCPKCDEEAEINRHVQIYCSQCEECFEMPEPDHDDYDDERYAYGY